MKQTLNRNNMWWDFQDNYIIVECDHPKYPKILRRYKFSGIAEKQIEQAEKFIDDIVAGRVIIRKRANNYK